MKHTFFKLRSASFVLALSGLMITLSVPSFAGKNKAAAVATAAIEPSVTYVGSDDNAATFLVKTEAASPVKFQVSIRNNAGEIFYSQAFEAASFSKAFKVLNNDGGDMRMTFIIKVLPEGKTSTFVVSSEQKVITEVAVSKTK